MTRFAAITAFLLAGFLLMPISQASASPDSVSVASPSLGSTSATTPTAKTCTWKKKRVVKKVRRNGRIKRIVKVHRWHVCRPVPPPAPARLGVRAFEFGFTLTRQSIKSGDTIVELNNRGEDEHDLHLQRLEGGPEFKIDDTAPLSYNRLRFTTEAGTYRLWCSLPEHAERGMDTTVQVTAVGK